MFYNFYLGASGRERSHGEVGLVNKGESVINVRKRSNRASAFCFISLCLLHCYHIPPPRGYYGPLRSHTEERRVLVPLNDWDSRAIAPGSPPMGVSPVYMRHTRLPLVHFCLTLLDKVSEMLRSACKRSGVGMAFLSFIACRSERLFTPSRQSLGVDCTKGKNRNWQVAV